jgi:hypothetical protein
MNIAGGMFNRLEESTSPKSDERKGRINQMFKELDEFIKGRQAAVARDIEDGRDKTAGSWIRDLEALQGVSREATGH